MSSDNFKQQLFDQFARVGKALCNGNRLELVEYLAQGERSVDELAQVAGLSTANTSKHLQMMRQVGLVKARKQGLKVYYQLSGDDVLELFYQLRRVAENHLAEVDRLVNTYLKSRDELEPLGREELLERAREGLVTILDVRPPEEYASGHLPNALNVPIAELEEQLDQLNPEQEIIAYCRGPHCVLAFEAVARLRNKGFKAHRLEDGFPEWKSSGLPVEQSK